jgi:hypothetical protein
MVQAVVFSKDRPLQLTAYLESLLFCTGLNPDKIHVIIPDDSAYRSTVKTHDRVHWHRESLFGGFGSTLRHVILRHISKNDNVLFGCDDVVFIRQVNLQTAADHLRQCPSVVGFSLRMGANMPRHPASVGGGNLFYQWHWPNAEWHWGYPFELMASVYRGGLVRHILSASDPDQVRTPNHFENLGVAFVRNSLPSIQPLLTMFKTPSYAVGQDVNRVQHDFTNATGSTVSTRAVQNWRAPRLDSTVWHCHT